MSNTELRTLITGVILKIDRQLAILPSDIAIDGRQLAKSLKIEKLIFQAILNPTTTKEMLTAYRSKYLECISKQLEYAESTILTGKTTEGFYLMECKETQKHFAWVDGLIQRGKDLIDERTASKLAIPEDSDSDEEEDEGTILTNWSIPSKPEVLCFVKLGQFVYQRVRTAENPLGVIDFTTSVAILLPRGPVFPIAYRHYRELVIIA